MWNFICIFARKIFNYMPMDNRNTVQLNSFVGCLGNSSETGLKNQMKESKASERKTTQQSLFFHLLFYVPYSRSPPAVEVVNMISSLLKMP